MVSIEDKIALSSCCCSSRFDDGYEMLEWIAQLGFKQVELSHGISIHLVPGILQALQDGVISVASVHNFCPLPMGIQSPMPNLFKPSSRSKAELRLWSRYTLETFDFAQRVQAKKVVMHSGSAWFFFQSPVPRLMGWIDQCKLEESELASNSDFIALRDKVMAKIRRSSNKHYRILKESFASIVDSAKERGVELGIENREGFSELPLDADHAEFVKNFSLKELSPIRYWHDAGHAEIKVLYGLLDHEARLIEMKDFLTGYHLHDVSESGRDHQEIGTGIIDFNMLARHIDVDKHTLVLELSPSLKIDALLRSRDYLLNCLS